MGKGCGDVEAIERLWSGRMGRIEGSRARRDGEEKAGRDQGLITLGRDRDRRGSSRRHCDELSGGRETVGIAVEGASFLTARTVCFLSRLRSRQARRVPARGTGRRSRGCEHMLRAKATGITLLDQRPGSSWGHTRSLLGEQRPSGRPPSA